MPAMSRIGDTYSCGDTQAAGSGTVFVNGIPVARVGDATVGHPCGPPTVVQAGSPTVFADNIPVARLGDPLVPHTCAPPPHPGAFIVGSANVFADG